MCHFDRDYRRYVLLCREPVVPWQNNTSKQHFKITRRNNMPKWHVEIINQNNTSKHLLIQIFGFTSKQHNVKITRQYITQQNNTIPRNNNVMICVIFTGNIKDMYYFKVVPDGSETTVAQVIFKVIASHWPVTVI